MSLSEHIDRLESLLEATPERDISFQRKANALATKIEKFLRSRDIGKKLHYLPMAAGEEHDALSVPVREIDPKYKDIDVYLSRISASPGGRFLGRLTPPGVLWTGNHYALHLYILPDDVNLHDYLHGSQNYLSPTNEPPKRKISLPRNIHSTLVHELIHYFDFKRGGSGFKRSVRSGHLLRVGKMNVYYNTPEEFNAYYQQGANRVVSSVRKTISQLKKGDQKALFDIMGFANFANFTFWVSQSGFWMPGWVENLNTAYRRKFKKRLFDLYQHLRAKVVRAYEQKYGKKFNDYVGHGTAYQRRKHGRMGVHREWPVPGLSAGKGKSIKVPIPSSKLFIPKSEWRS